jgi:hypothetical protein
MASLPRAALPAWMSCALIVRVGRAVMGKRETCEPKPVPSFIKAHSIFHTHNIGECDEQNILNLELALFRLKHISAKQLTVTDLFVKT